MMFNDELSKKRQVRKVGLDPQKLISLSLITHLSRHGDALSLPLLSYTYLYRALLICQYSSAHLLLFCLTFQRLQNGENCVYFTSLLHQVYSLIYRRL
jgi:hypothetical protein